MMKISTPAYTHSSNTYHDAVKYELDLYEETLCLLSENDMLDDPLEVLKYITAAKVGSFHIGVLSNGLK